MSKKHATRDLALGIDVGGTGIKGAPVDLRKGKFAQDRLRIDTPKRAKPEQVREIIGQIADHFDLGTDVPIGITVPGVVVRGVVHSAANIDRSWIGYDADRHFSEELGRDVVVVNDADAAGVAELHHGAAKGVDGVVLVTTLGTGIGSALLVDGHLVPNTELGHLEIEGHDAESRAAESVRERDALTMEQWAERLQTYYSHLESLFWPDLIVVGGGVSKQAASFLPLLDLRTEIVPARLKNKAGIIGAARLAARGN
jgi:polyphosphate glucokinase